MRRGGEVLSPHFFNSVVSEANDLVNEDPDTYGFGFADDIKILRVGNDLREMAFHVQIAINKLMTWACRSNLTFNADKTKAMIFTRKIKPFDKPELTVNNRIIEYVDTFKYLGVTFDTKLLWTTHVNNQIKKAQASLAICRNIVGRYWGLSPKVTSWIYTAIVRPQITYGSIVWMTALSKAHICNKLNSVQRLACKMITSGIHSTPTAGMEILLGFLPLVEHIKMTATNCSIRLNNTGHWKITELDKHTKSHVGALEVIREQIPEAHFPLDKTSNKVRLLSRFETIIGNKTELTKHKIRPKPVDPETINCFTDGSKTDLGTGAAFIAFGHQLKIQDYANLGQTTTVFQAEITAISMATIELLDKNIMGKNVNMYVDSQGAIKALRSYSTHAKSVLECKRLVNKLAEVNTVTINWIPGHVQQLGNEIADRLAKRGTELHTEGIEPRLAISPCTVRKATDKWFKNRQDQKWQEKTDCRQTRLVLPSTEHRWTKCTKYLSRNEMRILTQVTTGHSCLKRHMFIMGMANSPDCELCGMEQTPIHIVTTCPVLCGQRIQAFNRPLLETDMIRQFNPGRIVRYALTTDLWKG